MMTALQSIYLFMIIPFTMAVLVSEMRHQFERRSGGEEKRQKGWTPLSASIMLSALLVRDTCFTEPDQTSQSNLSAVK